MLILFLWNMLSRYISSHSTDCTFPRVHTFQRNIQSLLWLCQPQTRTEGKPVNSALINKWSPWATAVEPTNDSERPCKRCLAIVPLKARELEYLSTNPFLPLVGACSWDCWVPHFSCLPCMLAKKTVKQWETQAWRESQQWEIVP